jgi:hypothetical protein
MDKHPRGHDYLAVKYGGLVWISRQRDIFSLTTCSHYSGVPVSSPSGFWPLFFTMATSNRHRFSTVIAYLGLLFGLGFAQRPTNASVCDFYAQERFGANNSETQLKFIQNVVSLAFEGGSRLTNVSTEITGILRPGKFNGMNIELLQYFNGSRASTNVNNAPIGINWLDQGGTTPLAAFLAGESQTLILADTSNQ